jgi:bifunctional oligoribonuclease and PAP phosphatase NrnA
MNYLFNPESALAPPVSGPPEPCEHPGAVQPILDVLRSGQRFLVCSHARPDGDALGSVLACGMILEQMGKHVDLISADHVPYVYRRLPGATAIRPALHINGPYDAVILLECDGLDRAGLHGLENFFLINIDHHLSGRLYANLNWIDREAASVGEMVYRLAKAAGARITPEIATCLYTTLLTDTGGFTYGSVRASTFEAARDLVLAGADPVRIAQDVCYSTPVSKMLLLGAALNNLHREGRVAWLSVRHEDMVRTCALEEDCEGIVNYAIGVADIDAAAFFRELPDGQVRLSLRSKGKLNVAAIAERMGGGGHENAAGCTIPGPFVRAVEEVVAALRSALTSAGTSAPQAP